MKRRFLNICLIAIGLILNFCFCQALFAAVPSGAHKMRYVSLAPSTTEILFALGLGDEIVGVSSYCNYPEGAKNKARVGDFSSPNIEKIVSLQPDYIFCTGLEQAPIIDKLKRMRLKVYVSDPVNIDDLFASILDIGKITDKEYDAQILVKQIELELDDVNEKTKLTPEDDRPKVFIEIWHDPLTTAGVGSFINELVALAGGNNIASSFKRPYGIFSPEEVIERDPDCIILTYMEKAKPQGLLKQRLGWDKIAAVKNNRIYNDIDADILLRPGPRAGKAIKEIHKRLYP